MKIRTGKQPSSRVSPPVYSQLRELIEKEGRFHPFSCCTDWRELLFAVRNELTGLGPALRFTDYLGMTGR